MVASFAARAVRLIPLSGRAGWPANFGPTLHESAQPNQRRTLRRVGPRHSLDTRTGAHSFPALLMTVVVQGQGGHAALGVALYSNTRKADSVGIEEHGE